ncbi:MAG: M55 family metallopeptidase [Thermomicrobiales bacterium]|nr:M55 family metallopeptidase [Thermomicrobiales bacterium]
MRVLVQADMEGASGVTDYRQVAAIWPEFWRSGRAAMAADAASVAQGLLDGGADEVFVYDGHWSGATNLDAAAMPEGVALLPEDDVFAQMRAGAFDAVFQVGRHARCGTNEGFIPHTQAAGLRLAIDGDPITESHLNAYRAGVPLLGITGDDRLATQLDGPLTGTPFLAVKRSTWRATTTPIWPNPDDARQAIRAFAADCMRRAAERTAPTLPTTFTLQASMAADRAAEVDGNAGLRRVSDGVLAIEARNWWDDAEPAMQVAMAAASRVLADAVAAVPATSEASLERVDPQVLQHARATFSEWVTTEE